MLKQIKKEGSFLIVFNDIMLNITILSLIILSGCSTYDYKLPEIEKCIIGISGCLCKDNRLPKNKRIYLRKF